MAFSRLNVSSCLSDRQANHAVTAALTGPQMSGRFCPTLPAELKATMSEQKGSGSNQMQFLILITAFQATFAFFLLCLFIDS